MGRTAGRQGGIIDRSTADAPAQRWYEQLYRAHAAHVLAYLRRRCARTHADDLLAEVFLVAWRRRDAAPDVDHVRAWLYRIAHNVLRNHYRSEERRQRLLERARATLVSPGTDALPDVDAPARLRRVLEGLREPDREVLRLAAWEECSHAEIAQVLGCSTGTVAVRLHRARRRLRAALDADDRRARRNRAGNERHRTAPDEGHDHA